MLSSMFESIGSNVAMSLVERQVQGDRLGPTFDLGGTADAHGRIP